MSSIKFTGKHMADDIKLFSISATIKNTKSFTMHPASIRRQHMTNIEQVVKRIKKDLIRLSIGIENRKNLKVCCLPRVFSELQA